MWKTSILFTILILESIATKGLSKIEGHKGYSARTSEISEMDRMKIKMKEMQEDLQHIKLSIFLNQNKGKLEARMRKVASAISQGNETEAQNHWDDIQIYLASYEQAKSIAMKVIDEVEIQPQETVVPLINFMKVMDVPQAYGALIQKLNQSGHFYDHHEPFLVAENIRQTCGQDQSPFITLPPVLRHVSSSIVTLKNKWNNGYLFYQSEPNNFFTWFSPHKYRNHYDGLPSSRKPRGHWEFNPMGDKIQIVNAYNGNAFVDYQTLFVVELASEDEMRLRVAESGNSRIRGKYLVGRARNRGEQFTQIEFFEKMNATEDQLRWVAQPVEHKPLPQAIRKC